MDIELRMPLLRWLDAAPLAQLRQATHALTRLEAEARLLNATQRAMAVAMPRVRAAVAATESKEPEAGGAAHDAAAAGGGSATAGGDDGDSVSPVDLSLSLPHFARSHILRFVDESVESLAQLADYLLTEQLSEAEDSAAMLRAHVRRLVHRANREQMQLLHQRFCSKEAQRSIAGAGLSTPTSTPAAIPSPVAAVPAPIIPHGPQPTSVASKLPPQQHLPLESAPMARVATEHTEPHSSLPPPVSALTESAMTSELAAAAAAAHTAAAESTPAVPLSSSNQVVDGSGAVAAFPSSSSTSSSSLSSSPALHFLQSDSAGNMDVLCLLLSYVGVWDLLGSASRVCRRWFGASLDPRCFRQIRSLRVTPFLKQDASAVATGGEWGWNAAPTQPLWPAPLPAHYDSFTRVLVKLSNLVRLELGPRAPDGVLRAIGEGERVRASETAATLTAAAAAIRGVTITAATNRIGWGFLSQLRVLSFRGCAALTDEGVRALVAHCSGHEAHVAAALPTPSGASVSTPQIASTPIVGSGGGGGADGPCPCFLHRVVQLDLSGCRLLTDRSFSLLFSHTPLLRHVDLSFCNGAGTTSLQSLARFCPRVTRLNLAGARGVSDDGLRAIGGGGGGGGSSSAAGLVHLRWLSLEDCWSVTSTGMMHLTNGCRDLRALNMAGTYNGVNEPSLAMLAARLAPRLTDLNFTGCPLTDAGVAVLMRGAEGGQDQGLGSGGSGGGLAVLQSLRASMMGRMGPSAAELSDAAVTTLALSRSAATLTTLDLTACSLVTDRAVQSLASSCVSLRSLTLTRCSTLSDACVEAIGGGVFSDVLEQLDLSHVFQLTDACLPVLQRCARLADLNLHKCLRISDQCWVLLQPRVVGGESSNAARCHQLISASAAAAAAGDGGKDLVPSSWSTPPTSLSSIPAPPADCCCTSMRTLDLSAARVSDHGLRRLAHTWRRSIHAQLARQGGEENRPALAFLSALFDSGSSGLLPAPASAGAASSSSSSSSSQPAPIPAAPAPAPTPSLAPSLLFPPSVCFSSVRSLVLTECHGVSDSGLCAVLPLLPLLDSLSLAGCYRVASRGVDCIARHCRRLRVLHLHQCIEVGDADVGVLARSLHTLREIGLDELAALSDTAVAALADGCPELRRVSLSRAPGVTFPALLRLMRACPHLERLNCSLAPQLTELATTHPDAAWQALLRLVARRGVEFLR